LPDFSLDKGFPGEMKNLFSAITFLTVIRLPHTGNEAEGSSVLYFPLVGLLLGGLLVGVDHAGSLFLSNELRALTDVLFLAAITGGLHLDGLADTADGFFSHKNKSRILEIMRDSRMGPMGGITLIFCLLFKVFGISGIDIRIAWPILLVAPAISRFSLVAGLIFMKNVRGSESLGTHLYQKGNFKLLVMGLIPVVILFTWNFSIAIFIFGIALATISFALIYFHKRIDGVTGDTLGALSEITETITFVAGAVVCRNWL
jgi:adenosylcobinamide-GDP ribazoletransferase